MLESYIGVVKKNSDVEWQYTGNKSDIQIA